MVEVLLTVAGLIGGFLASRFVQKRSRRQEMAVNLHNLLAPMRHSNYGAHNLDREDDIRAISDFCGRKTTTAVDSIVEIWREMSDLEHAGSKVMPKAQHAEAAGRRKELKASANAEIDVLLKRLKRIGK